MSLTKIGHKKYRISFRDENGKRRRKILYANKKIAQEAYDKIKTDVTENKYLDKHHNHKKVTFNAFRK